MPDSVISMWSTSRTGSMAASVLIASAHGQGGELACLTEHRSNFFSSRLFFRLQSHECCQFPKKSAHFFHFHSSCRAGIDALENFAEVFRGIGVEDNPGFRGVKAFRKCRGYGYDFG